LTATLIKTGTVTERLLTVQWLCGGARARRGGARVQANDSGRARSRIAETQQP